MDRFVERILSYCFQSQSYQPLAAITLIERSCEHGLWDFQQLEQVLDGAQQCQIIDSQTNVQLIRTEKCMNKKTQKNHSIYKNKVSSYAGPRVRLFMIDKEQCCAPNSVHFSIIDQLWTGCKGIRKQLKAENRSDWVHRSRAAWGKMLQCCSNELVPGGILLIKMIVQIEANIPVCLDALRDAVQRALTKRIITNEQADAITTAIPSYFSTVQELTDMKLLHSSQFEIVGIEQDKFDETNFEGCARENSFTRNVAAWSRDWCESVVLTGLCDIHDCAEQMIEPIFALYTEALAYRSSNLACMNCIPSKVLLALRKRAVIREPVFHNGYDLNFVLDTAIGAAFAAGIEMLSVFYDRIKVFSEKSSSYDIVTETDKLCEKMIVKYVIERFPEAKIIGEESHEKEGSYDVTDALTFIIDPIDGTTNFTHSFPFTCVSIGVVLKKQRIVGVVFAPVLRELYTAIIGHGAYHSQPELLTDAGCRPSSIFALPFGYGVKIERRITTSNVTTLKKAIVVTETHFDRHGAPLEAMLERLRRILSNDTQGLRALGSCALNMCSVASGRADANFEGRSPVLGPKPWDMSAAALIVSEAGGVVQQVDGSPFDLYGGRMLCAANVQLASELVQLIKGTYEIADSVRSAL